MMSGSHTEEREERAPERARAARAVTTTAATTATITSTDHPTETLKVKKRLSKKAVIWQDTPLTQPLHTAKVTATTEAREEREERDPRVAERARERAVTGRPSANLNTSLLSVEREAREERDTTTHPLPFTHKSMDAVRTGSKQVFR